MKRILGPITGLAILGMIPVMTADIAKADGHGKLVIKDGAIAKPLTDKPGDVEAGRKTAINRKLGNCLACHAVTSLSSQPFHGEVGPSLDGVKERYSEGELRLILVNSKKVFEGSIMPSFYSTEGMNRVNKKFKGKTILTAQQVEDVIAFLKTQ